MGEEKNISQITSILEENPHCLAAFRHGQTYWNVEDRLTTFSDIDLTELGENQPSKLSHALAPVKFDFVSASPRARAYQTAEIACSRMSNSPSIRIDKRLVEPSAGIFEGLTFEELRNGEHAKAFADYQHEINPIFPEGAETIQESVAKAESLLTEVAENPGRHLMFSHGAFLRILTQVAIGGNPNCYRRLKLGNCHGVIFKFYPNPPHQIVAWNISA